MLNVLFIPDAIYIKWILLDKATYAIYIIGCNKVKVSEIMSRKSYLAYSKYIFNER